MGCFWRRLGLRVLARPTGARVGLGVRREYQPKAGIVRPQRIGYVLVRRQPFRRSSRPFYIDLREITANFGPYAGGRGNGSGEGRKGGKWGKHGWIQDVGDWCMSAERLREIEEQCRKAGMITTIEDDDF